MLYYFTMSHGSYELNLGPKRLILARDVRLRSWPNIDGTYGTLLIISSKSKILDLTDGKSSNENARLTAYPWARSVPSTNIAISALNILMIKSCPTKLIDSMHRFVDFYIVKVGTISLRGTIYISHKQIFRLFWFTQS